MRCKYRPLCSLDLPGLSLSAALVSTTIKYNVSANCAQARSLLQGLQYVNIFIFSASAVYQLFESCKQKTANMQVSGSRMVTEIVGAGM